MGILFPHHLDYVFLVYGLAFVLVAAVCAVIPKESARGAPWIWLGLFGLVHGVSEWLEIIAIDLKDTPTLSVQLKEPNGVTNLNEVHTVTLTSTFGVLANPTVTTNGSGFASTMYKPNKGNSAFITATAPLFVPGGISVTINTPTTATGQNWLERDDIKPSAVTVEKLPPLLFARQTPQPSFGFISQAFQRAVFASSIAQDANSIVTDDDQFIYVNGFDGPGATNPIIEKINRRTGVSIGTLALTEEDFATGRDGMVYDGASIWVCGGSHLMQVNPVTLTMTNDYDLDAVSGTLQGIVWDGAYLYAYIKGSTTYGESILQIDTTGTVLNNSAPLGGGANVKQLVIDDAYAFFQVDSAGTNRWFRVALGSASLGASSSAGQYNVGTAVLGSRQIFVGGTAGLAMITTDPEVSADIITLTPATVGDVYDLQFDGVNLWAITGVAGGGGPRRFVRKISFDGSAFTIEQSFDLTPNVPNALTFDGQNMYVLNNDDGSIIKYFAGK